MLVVGRLIRNEQKDNKYFKKKIIKNISLMSSGTPESGIVY